MENAADLLNPIFTDEEAARKHYEAARWANGRICPHCGSVDNSTELKGKSTRPGVYKCKDCEKPFSVTIGTIFERSHIPLNKWMLAMHLMVSSKKGISAHQLYRSLSFGSYRTAWFMAHRIREAMTEVGALPPLGGEGKIVEADETYYGKVAEPRTTRTSGEPLRDKRRRGAGRGPANKRPVVALVERGGKARVFHVAEANKYTVEKIVRANVHPLSRLHTDESRLYAGSDEHFASHETVKHSANEYARGDVNTNSAEGFFGVFKKGMKGVYQHCGEQHLQRYVTEFEFRYNTRTKLGVTDEERAALALKGAEGKRLTYRRPANA
jgi:transposase-like protein